MKKTIFYPLLTIPLLLTLFLATNSYAQDDMPDVTACKLREDLHNSDLGFPVPDFYTSSLGTVNVKVLFVDFSDVPAEDSTADILDQIDDWADFYNTTSYGRVTLQFDPVDNWYRMNETSDFYLEEDSGDSDSMIEEAIIAADPDTDFSNADAVYIIASAYFDSSFYTSPEEISADGAQLQNVMVSAEDYFGDEFVHQVIAHELGHTFGLPDLYPSEEDNVDTFVGEFDVMGNLWGRAPEFFAYHRWRLGWLDDDQIYCFQGEEEDFATISAIEVEGGLKAIIIPINDHQLIVVESRRALGYDSALLDDGGQEGALVYVVDSDFETAAAGIIVHPDLGDGKIEAPLMDGESVTIGDVTIEVIDADANGETVLVTRGNEPPVIEEPEGEEWFSTGYLLYPLEGVTDVPRYGAGYSMYVAAWPMQQTYPGANYQSGLPGTWMYPIQNVPAELGDEELYNTIEGGLGWWTDTRFATETPKFIMGGVSNNFLEWANGPGAGAGVADVDRRDWDTPQGKYGVAQLSPYVLWAPDGLNLKQGTNGELFGYGYHPLPLIDAQQTETAGTTITTGDQSWTLFLDTGNFKGPVSFFIPNFFTKPALENASLDGLFLDTNPSDPNRSVQMETQFIPAVHATDATGTSYARITQMQYPANGADSSLILNQVSSYGRAALWDSVGNWFDGGAAVTGALDSNETFSTPFVDGSDSTFTLIYEGLPENEEYPIDWNAFATADISDPLAFKYIWNMDIIERVGDSFHLPTYYRLDTEADGGKTWRAVKEADIPAETGLVEHQFTELGVRNDSQPFVTPTESDSIWRSPGPVAGPFQAELGDGSVITYSWYRFVDQPAILHWGFSDAERDAMQARVEQIHRNWGKDEMYMSPPTAGQLADLDPNIIVTPPAGFEVGYVPIVTRQEISSATPLAVILQADNDIDGHILSAALVVFSLVSVMYISYRAINRPAGI